MLTIDLPIDTQSEANVRCSWQEKANRVKKQRCQAHWACKAMSKGYKVGKDTKLDITLTRMAPRVLDSDNLVSSLKAVRDGIADWLGIDDGSSRINWNYAQEYQPLVRTVKMTLREINSV